MHEGNPVLDIQIGDNGASTARLYIFVNVPIFSSRYFTKIKRTSCLGRLLALSLEILSNSFNHLAQANDILSPQLINVGDLWVIMIYLLLYYMHVLQMSVKQSIENI